MTVEEISPEQFHYEHYNASLLAFALDEALCHAAEFGYCDASRLAVRPRAGEYALMVTWKDGAKDWCHVTGTLLDGIRRRLAERENERSKNT